jgi:DNA-directed RNA polymerase alpha subunit
MDPDARIEDSLRLTEWAQNCLYWQNIMTVAELLEQSELEVLRMPGVGLKTLDAIKRALAEHGLALRPG